MPRSGKSVHALPLPVRRVLRKLGADVANARKRRRLTMDLVAERASISRSTLQRIEKGEPGASIGNVATVLFVLGLESRLGMLVDASVDPWVLQVDEERLPQRVRRPRRRDQP